MRIVKTTSAQPLPVLSPLWLQVPDLAGADDANQVAETKARTI